MGGVSHGFYDYFLMVVYDSMCISYSSHNTLLDRPLQLPLQGPLVMCPPAEDNYGVDACSVLCLDTLPPVVVMATCDGHLHHCVVLPNSEGNSAKKVFNRVDFIFNIFFHQLFIILRKPELFSSFILQFHISPSVNKRKRNDHLAFIVDLKIFTLSEYTI